MTIRKMSLILFFPLIVSMHEFAQERPSPSPGPPNDSYIKTFAADPERLDKNTYRNVIQMIDYAASVESEYRASYAKNSKTSDPFSPDKILQRKLPAAYQ